jgi:hypothetical protein
MNRHLRETSLRILLTAALCCGCGVRHPAHAAASDAPSAGAVAGPAIGGFRNAKFGMTEDQVRSAIETGFNIPASAITQTQNQLQRTTVLGVQIPGLVPQGGTAAVSYVFGYQSHRLIEVNILWSPEIDPNVTPQMLYQDGETLQQYFAGEGFAPNRSTGNIATPYGVLLFRTTDSTGNAVLLILSGTVKKAPSGGQSQLTPSTLTLAYSANALRPDVFQLAKGAF